MMDNKAGYQRVKQALKGSFSDELAAYPIVGAVTAQLVDKNVKDYLKNPDVVVKSQLAAYEILQQDCVTVQTDLFIEAEAMGVRLHFPEEGVCYVTHHPLQERKGKIDRLMIPDPKRDGRIPYILSACKELKNSITEAPVAGVIVGPWSLAVHLRGMKELIFDTFEDPQYVKELMKVTTETAKIVGEAMLNTGVAISLSEAAASCDIISPAIYREFIKPFHLELASHFDNLKAGITLHVCGKTIPILKDMLETKPLMISLDNKVSLEEAMEIIGMDAVIMGNVDTNLFIRGSRDEMDNAVEQCIKTAYGRCRYILCSGCEVPVNAPFDSLKWFMESGRKHGLMKS